MPRFFERALPTLPAALRVFCLGSMVLTLVGLVTRFVCAHFLHLVEYPYGFYVTAIDGSDLMTFYERFQHIHSPDFFSPANGPTYAYPAAVAPIYWLLFRVRYAQIPFVLIGAGVTVMMAWRFSQALVRRGVAHRDARWFVMIAGLCSYPFYFEFARGNVEIFMWFITAAAVYAIVKDRPWLGAGLLGIAIAMKIYPFVLLALLFSRRRYLAIVFSLAVCVAYTLFALWFVCPDLAVATHGINAGLAGIQELYVVPYRRLLSGVDHSLYGLFKRVAPILQWAQYARVLKWYTWIAATGGLVVYFARIRKLPMINQVLCLTVATVLLPPMSFDYTLIHLYTPFVMLAIILADRRRVIWSGVQGVWPMIGCLVVLLSQVGEVIVHDDRLGGQIKAVALLALFVLGLAYPLESEFDGSSRMLTGADV